MKVNLMVHLRSDKLPWYSKLSYLLGIALVLASLVINILPPQVVSAHSNRVTGSSVCMSNGVRTITWTISNDFSSSAVIESIDRTVSGIVVGTVVPKYDSVNGTETLSGAITGNVTLTIRSRWTGDGYVRTES